MDDSEENNEEEKHPNPSTLPITPRRSARLNTLSPAEIQLQQLMDRIQRIEINDAIKNRELQAIKDENKKLKQDTQKMSTALEETNSRVNNTNLLEALPGLTKEEMAELAKTTFTSIYHALDDENADNEENKIEAEIQELHSDIDYEDESVKNIIKTAKKMIKEWDVKLENYNKATEFFEKFDYYARVYNISKQQRYDRLTTALLSERLDIEFRAARKNQNIENYDDIKRWMFRSRDGIARIARFETKLSDWKMKKGHNLLQAFQELIAIINVYIEEIKFAKKWGAKDHEITRVPEPWLFNMFINATCEPYRTQLWDLYLKKVSGVRSMRKAELLVKHIHATRPMKARKAAATEEINAIFNQSGKWCSHHKSTSHNTSECRELKRENNPSKTQKEMEMEKRDWRNQRWRNNNDNNNDNKYNNNYNDNKWRNKQKYNTRYRRYANRNKRGRDSRKWKGKRKFNKKKAIFAIAKDILNWESSESGGNSSKQDDQSEYESESENKKDSGSDENRIISDEDDDEAYDESNEQAETIAALQKLVRAKYGYQSPRRH